MPSVTLTRPDVFPDGTSVSAYAVPNAKFPLPGLSHAPTGTAADTQTVSSGAATFTLAAGTRHVFVGLVGSDYRRVYLRTTETTTGLGPLQDTAATNPNGTNRPSWRTRRRALGLV